MYKNIAVICLFLMLTSCVNTVSIKNKKKGTLKADYQLVVRDEKRIWLDYETAPQSSYIQLHKDKEGARILTFINHHKNAIYFYDYEKGVYSRRIEYAKEGPNAILRLAGYFIKNMDSIYVYNRPLTEFVLTDSTGHVKQRISLRDNRNDRKWPLYFPQYEFNTVNPLVEIQGKIYMTGADPFGVADSLIHQFKFASCIDLKSNNVEFMHTYPEELYGSNVNWQDPYFTQAYRALLPDGKFIYSFPVSHDIYIASWHTNNYETVYAGSNMAGTIRSIDNDPKRTSREVLIAHILRQDLYTAILYDPYQKMYYRFMLQGIPGAGMNTQLKQKPIVVIIMDEQFNYLGETVIGTAETWNWENSFVTSEGLVMEYIDQDMDFEEQYMILKTFKVEKINK